MVGHATGAGVLAMSKYLSSGIHLGYGIGIVIYSGCCDTGLGITHCGSTSSRVPRLHDVISLDDLT